MKVIRMKRRKGEKSGNRSYLKANFRLQCKGTNGTLCTLDSTKHWHTSMV